MTLVSGEPIRVLLVDDEPDLRLIVRELLSKQPPFEVVGEASDGAEATEVARVHQPDLVLLDLAMPNVDGLTAIPRIHEAAPDAAVVVLSVYSPAEMEEQARERGAVAYLRKGIRERDLVDQLLVVGGVLDVASLAERRTSARLAGEPHSPRQARRIAAEALRRWQYDEELDTVELLVSELVTNVVTHAGSDLSIVVELVDHAVRVEVIDASPDPPIKRNPEPTTEHGRGVSLVDSLAAAWGFEERPTGKSVWFEIPRPDRPVGAPRDR